MTAPRRFTVTESREALLVTADNLDDVAEWCGGVVWRDIGDVGYGDEPGQYARPGCYLVTDGRRWWDVSADEFERQSAGWEEQT